MEPGFLETALECARSAGKVLVERLWERREIEKKGYRDTVTDADTAAETVILSILRTRFPDHAILSEETGGNADSPYTWLVDPLDGTTNYSRRHPTFSVSVALTWEGEPTAGVVHDPLRDHTFAARRGGGATLNGRPIHARPSVRLADALVGLDWAHDDAQRRQVMRRLRILAPQCRTVRGLGSAALALTYVGAGWLDLYFATGLHPWDTAAASLIVTEAGGKVTGWNGEPWRVGHPALLASGGPLHAEALKLWKSAERDA
ncbi:MAG: inositol monophosphatase family protein [Anaerolineae bacterium]|jgi:myo-inositol-1(or 4)-monophosphatase